MVMGSVSRRKGAGNALSVVYGEAYNVEYGGGGHVVMVGWEGKGGGGGAREAIKKIKKKRIQSLSLRSKSLHIYSPQSFAIVIPAPPYTSKATSPILLR